MPKIHTEQAHRLSRLAGFLRSGNFPMSIVSNESGQFLGEDLLASALSSKQTYRMYPKPKERKLIIVRFSSSQYKQLSDEYRKIFKLLHPWGARGMLIPAKIRHKFYEDFIPDFVHFLGPSRANPRGGDRRSPLAQARMQLKRTDVLSLQEIAEVIQLLIPNAPSYAAMQRDMAAYRLASNALLTSSTHLAFHERDSTATFVAARRKQLAKFTGDQISDEMFYIEGYLRSLRTELYSRSSSNEPRSYLEKLRSKKHYVASQGLREIAENLNRINSPDDLAVILSELSLIFRSGRWNYEYAVFRTDYKETQTRLHVEFLRILAVTLDRAIELATSMDEDFYESIQSGIQYLFSRSSTQQDLYGRIGGKVNELKRLNYQ